MVVFSDSSWQCNEGIQLENALWDTARNKEELCLVYLPLYILVTQMGKHVPFVTKTLRGD